MIKNRERLNNRKWYGYEVASRAVWNRCYKQYDWETKLDWCIKSPKTEENEPVFASDYTTISNKIQYPPNLLAKTPGTNHLMYKKP